MFRRTHHPGPSSSRMTIPTDKRIIFVAVAVVVIIIMLVVPSSSGSSSSGALRGSDILASAPTSTVWGLSSTAEFKIAIVADLDRQSRVAGAKKPTWKSIFKTGSLVKESSGKYSVSWDMDVELTTHLGEAGRGLELSELVTFQGKLLTFDDRSGIVFEVDRKHQCIPRYILTEGDGTTPKGQKSEWATVKDGKLYVGSFGKEYTNNDGSIKNRWNLWVKTIDANGNVEHVNWTSNYDKIRAAAGASFPGYMIQEAIHWDPISRHWFVLPRRVSSEAYDEKRDERMGSNMQVLNVPSPRASTHRRDVRRMMIANEDFSKPVLVLSHDPHSDAVCCGTSPSPRRKAHVRKLSPIRRIDISHVGPQVDLRGWSSFKFVPGTSSKVIVALKTEEVEDKATGEGSQRSFFTVFALDGSVLLPQTEIPGEHKYEGIEFL